MPITLDPATNILSLTYEAGDTKGDVSNPYTFEDIHLAVATFTKQGNQYYCPHRLNVAGVNTWLKDDGKSLYVDAADSLNWTIYLYGNVELSNCMISDTMVSERQYFRGYYKFTNCLIRGQFISWYGNTPENPNIAEKCDIGRGYFAIRFLSSNIVFNNCLLRVAGVFGVFWGGSYSVELNNCLIYDSFGISTSYTISTTIKNLRTVNASGIKIQLRNLAAGAGIIQLIDCEIDIFNLTYTAYNNEGEQTVKGLSTTSIYGENGVNIKIYDKDGVEIANGTIENGKFTTELAYGEVYLYSPEGTTDVTKIEKNYQPFKLVVSKAGYETEAIENITVTPGIPTTLNVTLKKAIEAMVTNRGLAIKANKENYGNDRDFALIT